MNTGNFLVWAFVCGAESVHSFSQESCRRAGLMLYRQCKFILYIFLERPMNRFGEKDSSPERKHYFHSHMVQLRCMHLHHFLDINGAF